MQREGGRREGVRAVAVVIPVIAAAATVLLLVTSCLVGFRE